MKLNKNKDFITHIDAAICIICMAKFIELVDANNRNTLVNVEHITSVVIYMDPNEIVRIYLNGDNESYITIKESYAELKEILNRVTEVNPVN